MRRWVSDGERRRDVSLSKALTSVLRHNAPRAGLAIRTDGFCVVAEVLETDDLRLLDATLADVLRVVRYNPKQRFELLEEAGELLIRAVQGHSIPQVRDELVLKPLSVDDHDLPEVCVHGTKGRNLASILHHGLLAGGRGGTRNHVHFQPFEPGDERVVSGVRDDCEIVIYIDLWQALADGVPFSMSRNNVNVSRGISGVVSADYIVKVRHFGGPVMGM